MEKKYAGSMNTPVTVSGRQLLENVHVPKLEVIVGVDLVTEPSKEPVLIKVIIDNFFSKVHMQLIIQNKG